MGTAVLGFYEANYDAPIQFSSSQSPAVAARAPAESPARIPIQPTMQQKPTRTDFSAHSAHITLHCTPPLTPDSRNLSGWPTFPLFPQLDPMAPHPRTPAPRLFA